MEAATLDEPARILLVDDEKVVREMLMHVLSAEGFSVRLAEDGLQAWQELQRRSYHLVLSDLKMPHMNGLELLQRISEARMQVVTIIMTAFGTVETAIEAMKRGAYDYILKPFKNEDVIRIIQKGLKQQKLQQENFLLKEAVTLYQLSEAMAHELSLDRILDIILDATLIEAEADVATLTMKHPVTGEFVERTRKYSKNAQTDLNWYGSATGVGELNTSAILDHYMAGRPLLAHGIRAL
ncbi:MAG TPA: response regulator, partial [Pseudomonadota bacterium]|nr:response regulator [Pseudomonadota bacterium]